MFGGISAAQEDDGDRFVAPLPAAPSTGSETSLARSTFSVGGCGYRGCPTD